ncbi:MAG TPA: cysteine desulfurase, partial [Firmicutes bacterium]|nr:cysteine desulfurase [Bacillota bacterium]
MSEIYLDYAATTPLRPEALEAMLPYLKSEFGNPSSVYGWARRARQALDWARDTVAGVLGADSDEIVFTAGGSEAINLALKGTAKTHKNKGKHIITTAVEHRAGLDSALWLEKNGFEVTFLPVSGDGLVDPAAVKEALRPETILVSVMHANNEIGTIQPIEAIGEILRKHGAFFHVDAVQTAGVLPVDVNTLQADLLSISAHKFYGPKGIGALYIRRGVRPEPLIHGGAQEKRRRAGTENVAGAVGLAKALKLAEEEREEEFVRLLGLRDRLLAGLLKIPHVRVNGSVTNRLPNNVNVSFSFIEGESLLLNLDLKGIAASS